MPISEAENAQIHAEVEAILAGGDPSTAKAGGIAQTSTDIPPRAPADIAPPPAAAAPPPAVAAAAASTAPPEPPPTPPAAPLLDEQTQAKMQRVRQQAIADRQAAQAEREKVAAELAELAKWKTDLARAKARGDVAAIARLHGLEPSRDAAQGILAEAMGKDAPAELRLQAQIAQLEREREADRAELASWRQELQQREQQQQQVFQQQQQREYVRATLLPQFGDKTAFVRALAADPEFADGVLNSGIGEYHSLTQQLGEAEPFEAFQSVDQRLERMIVRAMQDPVARARVLAKVGAPPEAKPIPPAEKQQPAPTLSNQQFTSTTSPPATASDWNEYQRQVRAEVEAMMARK